MPIEIRWYHEKRIISTRAYDEINVDDISQWSDDVDTYIEEGLPPVHILINTRDLHKLPTNVLVFKNSLRCLKNPGLGYIIIIGGSALVQSFAQILTRLTNTSYKSFHDAQSAVEFLQIEDTTLVS